jgi:MFS family permease
MAIWGAGSVVGIAVGFAGGAYIASHYGWRTAFFFTAIPGLICAVLAFTLREPLRGAAEEHGPRLVHTDQAGLAAFFRLLRIPTLRATIVAQTLLFFVLAADAFWLPEVLHRYHHLGLEAAGYLAGAVLILGGLIGTLAGGWLGDRLSRSTGRGNLDVGAIGFVVGAFAVGGALVAPSLGLFVVAFLIGVVAVYLYQGPFTATSQNVVTPALRASAVTLTLFVAHLLGDSYSTAVVGFLSDLMGSLRLALLVVSPTLLLLAAAAAVFGRRHVDPDTAAMEAEWARTREAAPELRTA